MSRCLINVDLTRCEQFGGQVYPPAPMHPWSERLAGRALEQEWAGSMAGPLSFQEKVKGRRNKTPPQHHARLQTQGRHGPAVLEAIPEPDLPREVAPTPVTAKGASGHLQVPTSLCPGHPINYALGLTLPRKQHCHPKLCPELGKAAPGRRELGLDLPCPAPRCSFA